MDDVERINLLKARGTLPARITKTGQLFIGEEELLYPIAQNSVKVQRASKRFNALTLTLFVGDVTVEPGSKACPSYARPIRDWRGAPKLDVIRYYLSRIPHAFGYHTRPCLGTCDPRRGRWSTCRSVTGF